MLQYTGLHHFHGETAMIIPLTDFTIVSRVTTERRHSLNGDSTME